MAYYLSSKAATLPAKVGRCGVLVLGYPTLADGTPHPVQRLRMEVGLEVFRRYGCERLILTGGSPHSKFVESETMAQLARAAGVPDGKMRLEKKANNTWENIRYSAPYLEGLADILIVSDSLHALRARHYLCRQKPELCSKAHIATQYKPFRFFWLKWFGAWNHLISLIKDSARAV